MSSAVRRRLAGVLSGVASLALAAAPASARAPAPAPADAFPLAATAADLRPPHLAPAADSVEGGLWSLFDKAEAHAKTSAERDPDPAIQAYVGQVACRLATEYCADMRVYVMDRPFLNATCAANGWVEVYSGMLLRARTEDELAFVLGHEISHFARNHSVQAFNNRKNTATALMVVSLGIGVAASAASYSIASGGSPYAGQTIQSINQAAQGVSDLVYLAGVATMFSYDRDQEAEADRLGFQRAVAAGYAPTAGQDLWRGQIAETQASDFAPVRRSETRASIFDTHPLTAERIAALRALSHLDTPAPPEALRRYRAIIRSHLVAWLRDDLRRRDYGQTLHLIDTLASEGEDLGALSYMRGEAFRLRRHGDDGHAALVEYTLAVAHADAPPEAWRELGESLRKVGDGPKATAAFQTYLDKAPQAQDRWLIEAALATLAKPAAATVAPAPTRS